MRTPPQSVKTSTSIGKGTGYGQSQPQRTDGKVIVLFKLITKVVFFPAFSLFLFTFLLLLREDCSLWVSSVLLLLHFVSFIHMHFHGEYIYIIYFIDRPIYTHTRDIYIKKKKKKKKNHSTPMTDVPIPHKYFTWSPSPTI